MKTPLIKLLRYSLLLACAGLLASCELDPADDVSASRVSSEDHTLAEAEFDAMRQIVDAELEEADLAKKTERVRLCPDAELAVDLLGNEAYRVEIDFGSGCNCYDGRRRAGKWIAEGSGKFYETGAEVEIRPENYRVTNLRGETYEVDFVKTVRCLGFDADSALTHEISVQGASFSNDSATFTWDSDRTRRWIAGFGDGDPYSNVFEIDGTANGLNRRGIEFEVATEVPLRVEASCSNVTRGILTVKPEGLTARRLDYGDGSCDALATLTVGTRSYPIRLR